MSLGLITIIIQISRHVYSFKADILRQQRIHTRIDSTKHTSRVFEKTAFHACKLAVTTRNTSEWYFFCIVLDLNEPFYAFWMQIRGYL